MIAIGRRLYERGLIVAAEGNISARLGDGRILVTPAGFCKGRMATDDLAIVDLGGRRLQGAWPATTELGMHLTALRARPDIHACVHAHPPYATAFAVAGIGLADCILPEVVATLGSVPLAEYATPSTPAVGASIEKYLDRFDAFLLKNHGVLTLGVDLESAYRKMETVERFAQIVHLARSLDAVDCLSCRQVDELLALSRTLHSRFSGTETPVCGQCRVGEPAHASS
ncbi:MAG: class II aldolase/adducin family protein [candidate division Zixibacteria bacterium]|nr:class II aldolase/adducin family protein [candidate division Zixibacteria bacterium]